MKKYISMLVFICMLAAVLAGCGKTDPPVNDGDSVIQGDVHLPDDKNNPIGITEIPDGLTGIDVSKLLLAGERLGKNILSNGKEIFSDGVETYNKLAARAKQNLNVTFLSATPASTSLTPLASGTGEMITKFDEISRNFEEFESMTERIVGQAEHGAQTIDFVKKYIRILDTWVNVGHESYYLHVEENSETIYRRSIDRISICHRYKNEEGDDVYEMFDKGFEVIRSTYIEGKKYSLIFDMGGTDKRYQGICANKDKGYWEIFDVIYDSEWMDDVFSTGFIIMKDDICYKVVYSRLNPNNLSFTVTTPDRKSDILLTTDYDTSSLFSMNLACLSGYKGVIAGEGNIGTLILNNGLEIDISSRNLWDDGTHNLSINAVYASTSAFGTEGELVCSIRGGTSESRRKVLSKFLTEKLGLTSKYDLNLIFPLVDRAAEEFEIMREHLKWNGHGVNSKDDLMAGLGEERKRFSEMDDMYKAIEKAPEINGHDEKIYELLISFPEITEFKNTNSSIEQKNVSIGNISLTVNDTLLLVENEPYKVSFALLPLTENSGLVHIAAETKTTPYTKSNNFSVSAENVSFELPVLEAGEYTLVAYISSSDGIRTSKYVAIPFDTVSSDNVKEGNVVILSSKNNDGTAKINYTVVNDASVILTLESRPDYATFYKAVADKAFEYGMPSDAAIELVDPDTKQTTALSGEETEIADGLYLIGYSIVNGEKTIEGDIFVEFSVKN